MLCFALCSHYQQWAYNIPPEHRGGDLHTTRNITKMFLKFYLVSRLYDCYFADLMMACKRSSLMRAVAHIPFTSMCGKVR
jgi:hypothetical protein